MSEAKKEAQSEPVESVQPVVEYALLKVNHDFWRLIFYNMMNFEYRVVNKINYGTILTEYLVVGKFSH